MSVQEILPNWRPPAHSRITVSGKKYGRCRRVGGCFSRPLRMNNQLAGKAEYFRNAYYKGAEQASFHRPSFVVDVRCARVVPGLANRMRDAVMLVKHEAVADLQRPHGRKKQQQKPGLQASKAVWFQLHLYQKAPSCRRAQSGAKNVV